MSNRQKLKLSPASETRHRLADMLASVRGAEFGSTIGLLRATGKISDGECAAAQNWLRLTSEYAAAVQAPRHPVSVSFETSASHPPDADSIAGQKVARRHIRVIADYNEALRALRRTGRGVEVVIDAVVIRDRNPVASELDTLHAGLQALSEWRKAAR